MHYSTSHYQASRTMWIRIPVAQLFSPHIQISSVRGSFWELHFLVCMSLCTMALCLWCLVCDVFVFFCLFWSVPNFLFDAVDLDFLVRAITSSRSMLNLFPCSSYRTDSSLSLSFSLSLSLSLFLAHMHTACLFLCLSICLPTLDTFRHMDLWLTCKQKFFLS